MVLPQEREDLLLLRPLGGTESDACGIYLPLERDAVQAATFAPPNPEQAGDHTACALLRDAVRLGFRAGAGPFRSLGRIAVEPRPYQLVPLLMALKLDVVRIVIADDLLATGGTSLATVRLTEKLGGNVVAVSFVIELETLKGRDRLDGYEVVSLLKY